MEGPSDDEFLVLLGGPKILRSPASDPPEQTSIRCLPPFKVRAGVLSSEWDDWQTVSNTSGFAFVLFE